MKSSVVLAVVVMVVIGLVSTATSSTIPHHLHHFPNKRQAEYVSSLSSYDVIHPRRVSGDGTFLSHHLTHTHDNTPTARRKRRALHNPYTEHDLHYLVTLDGTDHQVTLRPNGNFLAPHAVVERVRGKLTELSSSSSSSSNNPPELEVVGGRRACYYHGYVRNHTTSRVALSACQGLTGYVRTDRDEYLIEPVKDHTRDDHHHDHSSSPHPHLVYKRSALPASESHTCSTPDSYEEALHARALWEEARHPHLPSYSPDNLGTEGDDEEVRRRRRKRSVSLERNVEVTVVADKKMVDYYSNEDITTYILTVMNMVSSVYHDASIGNAVNIYVVRIMLLEDPQYEEELDISHNAEDTLNSFCNWQQMINPANETHPYHHDVAVLITRYNICSMVTERCATLGVSEIGGMCQPLRSCNVNEDTGLQLAYTIAHEVGHNFAMNHDGPQNGCETQYGSTQHVMSPHLVNDAVHVTWSNCSRKEITHFFDREWGSCLEDEPPEVEYSFPELPPGAMYDADHQCRLSFGAEATHCGDVEDLERVCQTLWCHLDNRCLTRMEPAAEGTQCGKHKWCSGLKCVTMGERPAAIHGSWGAWSEWSPCSRTCGAGVEFAHRHCDNPAPANGGRYCTGDRKKYRICNTQECPENGVSFRAVQCSQYDHQPYKGANHTWHPVMFDHSACQLDCKSDNNEFHSVTLAEMVTDGTPCKPGTRDMCIRGICKRVACDWTIEGTAQEDRCGLCHGDGTQCVTHRGFFNVTRGSGYVPVVTFPTNARNVKVEEVQDAANYLAVRDNITGEYYFNGNWIIRWTGEYIAGSSTIMYYSREGESEDLFVPGPLKMPLTLMLLFQTENPGLRWEYTLAHENATYTPTFSWRHSDWSVCTVTCGGGRQVSRVQCLEKEAGLVEDKYCEEQERPEDISRACNIHACPAWWWSGPWQPCSITCGVLGMRRRTVICVRSYGPSEQMALLDSACDNSAKPHETEPCPNLRPCPRLLDWSVGPWSQSCMLDPCEYEEREVTCVMPAGGCDPLTRPPARRQCGNITCGVWEVDEWSLCSADCGEGVQFRRVSCVGGLACLERDEPRSVQECTGSCLEEEEGTVFEVDEEIQDDPSTPSTVTATAPATSSTGSTVSHKTKVTTNSIEPSKPSTFASTSVTSSTYKASTSATTTSEAFPTSSTPRTSTTTTNTPTTIPSVIASTSSSVSMSNTTTASTVPGPNTTTATLTPDVVDTLPEDELNGTLVTSPFLPTSTLSTPRLMPDSSPEASSPITTTQTSVTASTTSVPDVPVSKAAFPSSTTEESASEDATESEDLEDAMNIPLDSATTVSSPTWIEPDSGNTEEPEASTETLASTLLPADHDQITTIPEESSDFDSSDEENVLMATTTIPDETGGANAESESDTSNTTVTTVDEPDNTGSVSEKDRVVAADAVSDGNTTTTEKPGYGQMNFTDISQNHEALNEVDVDFSQEKLQNKSDERSEELSPAGEEPNKESNFTLSVLGSKGIPPSPEPTEKKEAKTSKNDASLPESESIGRKKVDDDYLADNDLLKSTKKYPTPEHPTKNEETNEVDADESNWLNNIEVDIESEETPEETNGIFPDLEEVEETRPEGVVVDKVDIDGYNVIEVVELPTKGKGKKKRKKVLLHTGAEAVDVLHKLAEEQEEKLASNLDPTSEYTPDYQWNLTQWSECSMECGGGEQERSVQCLEQTTGVPVLPERCPHPRPHTLQDCNMEECREWETKEWGECSAECDVGERVRVVECPSGHKCPSTTRPPEVEPCNLGSCSQWVEGPWSLCTRSCGGGYQIRHVKCVDVRTQEPAHTCPKDTKPRHKMACHNQRCPKNRRGEGRRGQQRRCKDRLATKLCRRLKHMCSTKYFRVKCCRTCLRRGG